jgi:chromosome partitioning protein
MTRLAVFNSKGGVAKTTSVLNLAAASARDQRPALVLDLDPQGHLTRTWGEQPRDIVETLFAFFQDTRSLEQLEKPWPALGGIIPAHGQLLKVDTIYGKGPAVLNKLRLGLDHLERLRGARPTLIDCCPYTGVLSLNALFAADALLIPVATDYLSMNAAFQITQALAALEPVMKRRLPRRYVLTRFDRRRNMSADIRSKLHERFGEDLCETFIVENVSVAESPAHGRDVFAHNSHCSGANDYRALYEELKAEGLL